MVALGECFAAGVAEVVSAGAGHMGASLDLLDHLSTLLALSKFRTNLKLHGNPHPALPVVLELVAIRTMFLPT